MTNTYTMPEDLAAVKHFMCERCNCNLTNHERVLSIESEAEYLSLLVNTAGIGKAYILEGQEYQWVSCSYDITFNTIYEYSLRDIQYELSTDMSCSNYVLFYDDPSQLGGYSSDYYAKKRRQEMWNSLVEEMKHSFPDFPRGFIIVPRFYYSKSSTYEFAEGIYHYIAGTILKDRGLIVANEYQLCLPIKGIPDLTAVVTSRNSGAFLSDIEYKGNQQESSLPDLGEAYAIEIKRKDTLQRGETQLSSYVDGVSISKGLVFCFDINIPAIEGYRSSPSRGLMTLTPSGTPNILWPTEAKGTPDNSWFEHGIKVATIRGRDFSDTLQLLEGRTFYESHNILLNK